MSDDNDPPLPPDEACEMLARALALLGLTAAAQDEVLDLVAERVGPREEATAA